MNQEEYEKECLEENLYQEEASKLEGILKLMPCQKAIRTSPDYEDIGVYGFCEKGHVSFWDQTYLSKKRIQDTCRKKCPYCSQT